MEYEMYDDLYGDEFEDDEFGISQNRVQRILRRKAKLEAMMAVSSPGKQRRIARKLQRINNILERSGYSQQAAAGNLAAAAAGIEGIGGLQFQAQSPPGVGRLLRLPFYPTTATNGVVTSGGNNVASATNPVIITDPAAAVATNVSGVAFTMRTPQISWATLRIVGFESSHSSFKGLANPGPTILVADLQIGGGANLFTHEDAADSYIYDANQPEFCGLRDYPILKSPNTAEVVVTHVGSTLNETTTFSCALLCEVLVDDNYGAHIPGPYSRQGALVRQGGSFV
tara:strand:- start:520 stop:1371 length:852 start_codon:yes stop_codon:yes gene_type:complete